MYCNERTVSPNARIAFTINRKYGEVFIRSQPPTTLLKREKQRRDYTPGTTTVLPQLFVLDSWFIYVYGEKQLAALPLHPCPHCFFVGWFKHRNDPSCRQFVWLREIRGENWSKGKTGTFETNFKTLSKVGQTVWHFSFGEAKDPAELLWVDLQRHSACRVYHLWGANAQAGRSGTFSKHVYCSTNWV